MSVFALFALTVIPLILTSGPDMLFILSQVMGNNAKAGIKATIGIDLGYLVHSILVAFGIAAILGSFPVLFESIRWLGIAYLLFLAFGFWLLAFGFWLLAFGLIKSVFSMKKLAMEKKSISNPIQKGFLPPC